MEQGLEPCTYFNPRSPHRERRCHAAYRQLQMKFQSTLPSQGATNAIAESSNTSAISIHAPLTGSDYQRCHKMDKRNYFNPRSPHRERQTPPDGLAPSLTISIHAPLTGSDDVENAESISFGISIHAPLTGSDRKRQRK